MKTYKSYIVLLGILFATTLLASNVFAGECRYTNGGGETLDCCNVYDDEDTEGYYTLRSSVNAYNVGATNASWAMCRDEITFGISTVYVKDTLSLEYEGVSTGLIIDGALPTGGNVTLVDQMGDTTKPLFDLAGDTGVNNVTIRNMVISGGGSTFVRCTKGTNLAISGIVIQNPQTTAINIENCNVVNIDNITFSGGGNAGNFIQVQSTDDSTLSTINLTAIKFTEEATGNGIVVTNATNVGVDVPEATNLNGTVVKLDSIDTVNTLNVTATNVASGVYLNEVNNNTHTTFALTLTGNGSGSGIGLELDQNITDTDFSDLTITGFGGDGIVVRDSSDRNVFSGLDVYSNGGYGLNFTDQTKDNEVSGSSFYDNGNCGIYFGSEVISEDNYFNKMTGENNIANNGSGCAVGGTAEITAAASDATLIKTIECLDADCEQTSPAVYIIYDRTKYAKASSIELHTLYVKGASDVEPVSNTAGGGSGGSHGIFAGVRTTVNPALMQAVGKVAVPSIARLTTPQILWNGIGGSDDPTCGNDRMPCSGGSGGGGGSSQSYLHEFTDPTNDLPASYKVDNNDNGFMLIFKNSENKVIGIWTGYAGTTGNYQDGDCVQNPYNDQEKMRLYDPEDPKNSDEDSLPDYQEDKNLNCVRDTDETDPYSADTDGDGLDDYQETVWGTKSVGEGSQDSDADGIADGAEDADNDGVWDPTDTNGDGVMDSGETMPNVADTDKDGLKDGDETALGTYVNDPDSDDDGKLDGAEDENCPMSAGSCYYDNCIPGVVPSTIIDNDEDGIMDYAEDANQNCQYDSGELKPDNKDTDGDGIPDNLEDKNLNGQFDNDGVETDGTSTDTDADCITDGLEDKDHDGEIDYQETDPKSTDTDVDGIIDGKVGTTYGEDYNCSGTVDAGETKPYEKDTDGDGVEDVSDTCPWSINQDCVVRYCGINGFDTYDADSDGLADKQEDFNGDCAYTPENKEPDPLDSDSDDDTLTDAQEVNCFKTNPNTDDTDGDGKTDAQEVVNSMDQCEIMFNLGDSDPLNAEYGACSLRQGIQATSDWSLPILILGTLALLVMARKQREQE